MCAICGVYWFDRRRPADELSVRRMCSSLRHRGPDDEGVYLDNNVALGSRRLSILDLSSAGHQPMGSRDGNLWIAYNGETYNFRELRALLQQRGYKFESNTDTEVVLQLYQHLGARCLRQMNGMFGLAIWEHRKRRLFLARDRLGIKPLYYLLDREKLLFASEIKALFRFGNIDREIDEAALDAYLTYGYIPAPKTIFKRIKKLPPGHTLTCEEGRVRVERYWELREEVITSPVSEERCADELLERITDAVRMRLVSDVPVGLFLSGGVDSSFIGALMQQESAASLKTFSIGFYDKSFDETQYARQVSTHLGTEHCEYIVQPDVADLLPQLTIQYDEPFADPCMIPTYYLSKLAREHVTVCLSGDGGDEACGGYLRYMSALHNQRYDTIPEAARQAFRRLGRMLPMTRRTRARISRLSETMEERYLRNISVFDRDDKKALLTGNFRATIESPESAEFLDACFSAAHSSDLVSRLQYVDVLSYLPGNVLEKVDKASMKNSLEVRVPLLDHRVLEYSFSLPLEYKIRGNVTKYLLRQLAARILPPEIAHRKKMGFSVPVDRWLRGELSDFSRDILTDKRAQERGYFDQTTVQTLLSLEEQHATNCGARIWSLLVFELWCRALVDEQGSELSESSVFEPTPPVLQVERTSPQYSCHSKRSV